MFNGYKTYTGLLIALVPTIAQLFGYSVAPGFDEHAASLLDATMQFIGLAIAFYGRLVAETPGLLVKK